MINLTDCIEIGRFTRSHGYKGDLILKLKGFNFDEIIDMEWVFVLIDGLPVPFFIENFSERSTDSILVKIEDVDSIDKTPELINTPVYLSNDIIQNSELSSTGLNSKIGYAIKDTNHGFLGAFDSVIESAQNPLIRILDKRKEILLPIQDEFILDINDDKKEITVSCPPGLLDLY